MIKGKDNSKQAASGANSTPLSGYKKNKKVLTPPMATIPNMVLQSWINDRLPDMLWAILIRHDHPGDSGYAIFRQILRWLADNSNEGDAIGVTHTDIAQMANGLRTKFITEVVSIAGTNTLRPLLLIPGLPAYDD